MKPSLKLNWSQQSNLHTPEFRLGGNSQEELRILNIPQPVCLDIWKKGSSKEEVTEYVTGYTSIQESNGNVVGEAELAAGPIRVRVIDEWVRAEADT